MSIEHPGKEIERLLSEVGMSRKDLAIRTKVTEKHINTLISGERNITTSFAKKIGYVFSKKDSKYWQDIQNAYDLHILNNAEKNDISEEEFKIANKLGDIIKYAIEKKYIENENIKNRVDKVLELRKLLKISELTLIPKLSYNVAYRAQLSSNVRIDPYVLFAWQAICEKETENMVLSSEVDIAKLKSKLSNIKEVMFDEVNVGFQKLQNIFSTCGIAFKVVRSFKGAPVQGFIKQVFGRKLILCLTIRRARADTFWFTLFHEIAHIFNEDYKKKFIDFDTADNETELKADEWARNYLIPPERYRVFVNSRKAITWNDIETFAKEIKIKPFIVLGRLQKDQILDWSDFSSKITMYKWIEEI